MRMAPSRLVLASLFAAFASPAKASPQDTELHLEATTYLDIEHPRIVETVERVTAGATTDRERAVRLHDFVRDEIRFGWAPPFWNQTASQVLESGVGYCNTKSTLFVALLRAADIPARQVFVTIDARILRGLTDPGSPYIDHSYVEVWLEDEWIRTDSYIVDRPLARAARARLRREDRVIGYGVHVNGVSEWDGRTNAFAQFVDDGTQPNLTTRTHGVYRDIGAFMRSDQASNLLPGPLKWVFRWFARAANRRADEIRAEIVAAPLTAARLPSRIRPRQSS